MHALVALAESFKGFKGLVAAAVVNEDQLEFHRKAFRLLHKCFVKQRHSFLLVVAGNDDAKFLHK